MALTPIEVPIGLNGKTESFWKLDAFYLDDVVTGADHILHPAFYISGVEQPYIAIGRYQATVIDNVAHTLYNSTPTRAITRADARTACAAAGLGFHMMTNAEWAALTLWLKKNGQLPYGNNNFGVDSRGGSGGIPATESAGRPGVCKTGTGPLTWSHNRAADGIWDLNGNINEFVPDVRINNGQLQVIPYNNAGNSNTDTTDTSTLWRALKYDATSYSDLFISDWDVSTQSSRVGTVNLRYIPEDSATTFGLTIPTCAWTGNGVSESSEDTHKFTFNKYACTQANDSKILGTFTKQYLVSIGLLKNLDGTQGGSGYRGSMSWCNYKAGVYYANRGGYYADGDSAGMDCVKVYNTYDTTASGTGFRIAYKPF